MTTAARPITHGGVDRRKKLCRCSKCGVVEMCTPARDFFTLGNSLSGPLLCSDCFNHTINNMGVTGPMLDLTKAKGNA